MERCVGLQASDLDKLADALHLRLSWVRTLLRWTVTLGVLRATGLPDRSCLFDKGIIAHQ